MTNGTKYIVTYRGTDGVTHYISVRVCEKRWTLAMDVGADEYPPVTQMNKEIK